MDEDGSMRNCTYGFSDNGIDIYSNLNLSCLENWLERLGRLKDTDQKKPLLEPDKNLVVVDINKNYLDHILETLFPEFISKAEYNRVKLEDPPNHHFGDSFVDVYSGINDPYLDKIRKRDKYADSLAEKLTRQNAEKGNMGLLKDPNFLYHVSAKDAFGLNLIAHDEGSKDALLARVYSCHYLKQVKIEEHTKKINAVHCNYVWRRNTIPEGIMFEIQFETKEEHIANKEGFGDCVSHKEYGDEKLDMLHDQGNNQIIILQKNGHTSKELGLVGITNEYAKYTVVNY